MGASADGEELRLVQRFEELGPGVRVRVTGCPRGVHDGILARPGKTSDGVPAWSIYPPPACQRPGTEVAVSARMVAAGKVHRWVDYDRLSQGEADIQQELREEARQAFGRALREIQEGSLRRRRQGTRGRITTPVPETDARRTWACLYCFCVYRSEDGARLRQFAGRHLWAHRHLSHAPEWKTEEDREAAFARTRVDPRAREFDLDEDDVREAVLEGLGRLVLG